MSWFLAPYVFIIVGFSLLLSFVFIWIRITFCRFRYDMLIIISWKVLLPFVLCLFVFFLPLLLSFSITNYISFTY
jgi:NADH:ubiquinone oxidoreductase subunit H